jgi:hypothetical protein
MIDYRFFKIQDNINKTINLIVKDICKENKINYQKQEYKILFSNEKILFKNNDIKFTSGSKKSLSFYGKTYLNKKGKIIESIYLKDSLVQFEPENNSLLIMCEGVDNSTMVENDEYLTHFYVAPEALTSLHDPILWQYL